MNESENLMDQVRQFEQHAYRYLLDGHVSRHYIEKSDERSRPKEPAVKYWVTKVLDFEIRDGGLRAGRRVARELHLLICAYLTTVRREFENAEWYDADQTAAAEVCSASRGRTYYR